jgi:two-component system response regulator NreC
MLLFLRLASVPNPEPDAEMTEPIRIILADDHAAMRQSLRVLLQSEADLDVIAETDTLQSVIGYVRERQPDVLVLDLGMPDHSSGIEALGRLKQEAQDTKIVVLTMNDDPALRDASRWRRYLSPQLAAKLDGGKVPADRLTPREREVLRLIALGHTSVEIAQKLGLSPRTIETHRARIHRKLGLDTRAELVHYALRHELLQL